MRDNTRQMLFFVALAIVFLLLFSGIILSTANGSEVADDQAVPADSIVLLELKQYEGDAFVAADETIETDILVTGGTLTVAGTIYGDV